MLVHQHDECQGGHTGSEPRSTSLDYDHLLWQGLGAGKTRKLHHYRLDLRICMYACGEWLPGQQGQHDEAASWILPWILILSASGGGREPQISTQAATSGQQTTASGSLPACYRCRARCCRGRLRPAYEMLDEACPCRVWTRPSSLQPSLKDSCALQELRRRRPIPCRSVGL